MKVTARMKPGTLPHVIAELRGRVLVRTAEKVTQLVQLGAVTARGLAPNGPTGNYKAGIGWDVKYKGVGVEGKVGSRAKHAYIVEKGRSGGKMPPAHKIAGLLGIPLVNAFPIARSIGQHGTVGHHVIERTRDALRPQVDRIARELAQQMGRLR